MGVDDAVRFADFCSQDSAWFEARDAAMVELLYGSGLRVGELVGLDVQPGPQAKGWIDLREAQAHVLGKGAKRRAVPVGSAALRALERWLTLRASPPGPAMARSARRRCDSMASSPCIAALSARRASAIHAGACSG
jgi:integrase/recombinase XerC